MDVETPLGYVDFTTEKDLQRQRSKSLKKRKRVGNRRPIGEKIAKPSRAHTTPRAVVKHVPEPESDVEESDQALVEEEVEHFSDGSESEDLKQPSTFSGALESLLGRVDESESSVKAENLIMRDAPKPTAEEEDEAAKLAKKARADSQIAAIQRKLFKNKDHRVPTFEGAELESKLRKVATRGVVKLFNAIKAHQKSIAGDDTTTRKTTSEATKKKFMDSLKRKGEKKESTESVDREQASDPDSDEKPISAVRKAILSRPSSKKTSAAPSWEVLRDDYLLGAKMKDWNKESDEE